MYFNIKLRSGGVIGEVSWNDFYQNLLLKGEGQEITIHSGVNRATAVLYPGAMYQGRKLPVNAVRIQTPQIDNIETKIREAERSMGITVRALQCIITLNPTDSLTSGG